MAEPGWYQDPSDTQVLRFWDGDGWSEHVAPVASTSEDLLVAGPVEPPAPRVWLSRSPLLLAIPVLLVVVAIAVGWAVARSRPADRTQVADAMTEVNVRCDGRTSSLGGPDDRALDELAAQTTGDGAEELADVVADAADEELTVQECAPRGWMLLAEGRVLVAGVVGEGAGTVRELLDGTDTLVVELQPIPAADGDDPDGGGDISGAMFARCIATASVVRGAVEQVFATTGRWPASMAELVGPVLVEDPVLVALTFSPDGSSEPAYAWAGDCADVTGLGPTP